MAYRTPEPTAASGINAFRIALLAASTITAWSLCAQPAIAQEAAAEPPAAEPVSVADAASDAPEAAPSDIVVTGSRLIREGLSSPTPVTSVSTSEILATRPQSIVQGLAELPALSSSTTPKSIQGTTRFGPGAFLNLRNLGVSRNLVLLDGRRVVPANAIGYVDVNLLPQALVSNVNIVTGGASAAYGSDAVAGAIDFQLNTRFKGLKAELGGGISDRSDGEYVKGQLAWGGSFLDDRLHVIASIDFQKSYRAYAENRDWASGYCAPIPIPGVTTANQSATNPRQTIACDVTLPYASYGGAIISGPLTTANQGITFGQGGVPEPFVYGTLKTTNFQSGGNGAHPDDNVNFSPPVRTIVTFGRAGYDITPDIELFVQATVGRVDANYPQTPPFFYQTRGFTIYSGNPFIPASIQQQMTARNIASFPLGIVPKDWGLVTLDSKYRNYDFVGGLQGKFGQTWNWDVSYEHGKTKWDAAFHNNVNLERLYRAADAVVGPNGQIVCRAAITDPSTAAGCVPINLFGPGSASPEALAYIQGDLLNGNRITQDHAEATLRGEPFSLWAGPVGVAVGAEWRKQVGSAYSDPLSQSLMNPTGIRGFPTALVPQVGGWLTSNPKPYDIGVGRQTVKEAFAEVLVPLLKEMPFAEALDFNGAMRVTDYSTSGTVVTWKAGMTYRPISDILFRITESRDIRAPSIDELYAGQASAPLSVNDPFRGNAPVNIKSLTTGNAALTPEIAKTFTVGATYDSSWLRGLGFSVDYYDIKIRDVLSRLSAQDTVDRCFAGATELCPYLIRDNTGTLANVLLPALNLTAARVKGVDIELYYRTSLPGGGNLNVRVIGSRLIENSTSTPTLTGVNYVDRVGDIGQGNPKWRFNASASVNEGPFGLDLRGRYIGPGLFNSTYIVGDIDDNHVRSSFVADVGLRYKLEKLPGSPELYFNVANIFDKDPPLVPGTALTSSQTNPSLYDTIGRAYSAGIRARF